MMERCASRVNNEEEEVTGGGADDQTTNTDDIATRLIYLVRLREEILADGRVLQERRKELRELTDVVKEYMEQQDVRVFRGVDNEYTVTLVHAQRLPPLDLDFVTQALQEYTAQIPNNMTWNSEDAAAFVFMQRKTKTNVISRLLIKGKKNATK